MVSTETKPLFSYAHAGPFVSANASVARCTGGAPGLVSCQAISDRQSNAMGLNHAHVKQRPQTACQVRPVVAMCAIWLAHWRLTTCSAIRSDTAWLGPMLGGAALLGSSLMDNSDLGGAEFLRGLDAFAAVHIACVALFGRGDCPARTKCKVVHTALASTACHCAGHCPAAWRGNVGCRH